jgi:sugar lactone lactonase YvrE
MNRSLSLAVSPMTATNRAAFPGLRALPAVANLILLAGVALGQSDVVFMAADVATGSKLVRFDAGTETFAVAPNGSHFFSAVTVLNDEVLVVDSEAIQRFSPDGTYLGVFVSPPSESQPLYLESDSNGYVYAMLVYPDPDEPFTSGVRYNSSGGVSMFFGGGDGIDADAAGNVYIAGLGSLKKYAPNGSLLNSISLGSINPSDLSIDEAGQRLYLADERTGSGGIRIFDISAAVPSLIGSIATPSNATLYGIHFASESGNILATDLGVFGSNDPRGLEYSSSGELLREYRPAGIQAALDIATFVPPEPPDYNGNGVWDAADYVVWRKGMPAADGNGNGSVEDGDYSFWRQRFGQPAEINAAAIAMPDSPAAVPEPATFVLGAWGALSSLYCLTRCTRT